MKKTISFVTLVFIAGCGGGNVATPPCPNKHTEVIHLGVGEIKRISVPDCWINSASEPIVAVTSKPEQNLSVSWGKDGEWDKWVFTGVKSGETRIIITFSFLDGKEKVMEVIQQG